MAPLAKYKQKRRFNETPEPAGKVERKKGKLRFVIQRHEASHLHYDFRLEADGVLKSWAVPKGPSLNPGDKRLAVMVEDHPTAYGSFHGDIPAGNYGAGHVEIWDNGTYEPEDENREVISEKEFLKDLEKGTIKFRLHGKYLNGSWALVKMKGRGENNWLLIKHKDDYAIEKVFDIESIPPVSVGSQQKAVGKTKKAESRGQKTESRKQRAESSGRKAANKKTVAKKAVSEAPAKAAKTISGHKVAFTNLDKVYFPDEGFTKGDIIAYYDKVSKVMLKYLKDRPESLRRTPNGIKDEGFFHKDVGDEVPGWIDKYKNWSESANKEIHYIVCNNKATLLYMANMGCIEINPWNSRMLSPDNPDYLIMDLDPSEHNTFDQVIETAQVIHEMLDRAKCANYCKTSGATGLHIYVPLGAKYTYDQARMFAEMVAVNAQAMLPKFTSVERSLKKRGKDKIYIDYLQNRAGQTLSSAYSVRPKPGATVSAPLEWSEVKPGLTPADFHILNMMERIEKKGDLFLPVLKKGIDMDKVLKGFGG